MGDSISCLHYFFDHSVVALGMAMVLCCGMTYTGLQMDVRKNPILAVSICLILKGGMVADSWHYHSWLLFGIFTKEGR